MRTKNKWRFFTWQTSTTSWSRHLNSERASTVCSAVLLTVSTVLSKAGKREELSAIFAKFGGKKLSDIKEEDYPALMKELEAANG